MIPNPQPELISDSAWKDATRLTNFEMRPFTIVEGFLTLAALEHFAHPPSLDDIPVDPPQTFDETLFDLTEGLYTLGEVLFSTNDLEDNLDNDFRVKPQRTIDTEEPHMDYAGSFLLLTLFQELSPSGTPWSLRLWPEYTKAPDVPNYAPILSAEELVKDGGQPVDLESNAGRLIILGGRAIHSASGSYSIPHQVIRPDYAGTSPEDRIVRSRIKLFTCDVPDIVELTET